MYPITKSALEFLSNNATREVDGKFTYIDGVRFSTAKFITVFSTVKDLVNIKCDEHPARNFLLQRLTTLRERSKFTSREIGYMEVEKHNLDKGIKERKFMVKGLDESLERKRKELNTPIKFDKFAVLPEALTFPLDRESDMWVPVLCELKDFVMKEWYSDRGPLDICSVNMYDTPEGNIILQYKVVPATAATMSTYPHITAMFIHPKNM
jgi:hypothetical protein